MEKIGLNLKILENKMVKLIQINKKKENLLKKQEIN